MYEKNYQINDNFRLVTAAFISLGLHLYLSYFTTFLKTPTPSTPFHDIAIILDQEEPKVEKSKPAYVSPSDSPPVVTPPKDTNLLSDKNYKVEKQSLKRGSEGSQPKIKQEKRSIKNLLLDRKQEVLSEMLKQPQPDNSKENATAKEKPNNESLISNMAALGTGGNSDFLPGVPDGEITMLNAKADRFAVFVRRVALQVFSNLKQSNWLDHPQLMSGFQTDGVRIRAILSDTGEFLKAEIISPSGLNIFDSTVMGAVKKGAWDRNPPKEALASDGNIRFIFESKAWVRSLGPGRKRQWLLLGTGLE